MKKTSLVLGSFLSFCSLSAWGQNPNAPLLKINDSIYKVSDFERLYTKNLDLITDANQKDVSNYLDLYVLYKLKLQKAYELKLDEKPSFKDELLMHRNQLAEKYFINEDKLKHLVEEALVRRNQEVRAKHILIKVDEYAAPKDSLNAYNKALEIRNNIINGLDFEEAAKTYSNDLSAQKNGGDLGYFSVFRMVYPFETGAFETPVGEVSMPVRSQFGYHLIKVVDKREKPKEREVSHIFISKNENRSDEETKNRAAEVYQKLKSGEDFGEMAVEYTDDQSGKGSQGVMGKFNEHNLDIPNVGAKVYELSTGQFTAPIESAYGFHIFKVDRFLPEPTADYLQLEFTRKVKSDSRSQLLDKELLTYLSKEYKVKVNEKELTRIKKFIDKSLFSDENWAEKVLPNSNVTLFSFDNENQIVKTKDYIDFVNKNKDKYVNVETFPAIANLSFEQFQKDILKKYYDKNLGSKHPEFAHIIQEYKDGLLLFELLENQIWEPAKSNEEELIKHYEANKIAYRKEASYKGWVYEFDKKLDAKKWHKYATKNENSEFVGYNNARKYEISVGENNPDSKVGFELSEIKDGLISKQNKTFVFIKPEIKPAYIPDFEEVKRQVVSEFTQKFENEYYEFLRQNSSVKIENEVLDELINKYSK